MVATRPCPVATLFVRAVRPGREPEYERWLDGISRASAAFDGYQGTTILRPDSARKEYVAIAQFDSSAHMQSWLDSQERARWLEQLESIAVEREQVVSLAGLERWFTLEGSGASQNPPRHKTALIVLLGLYPVVLLLGLLLDPALSGLPRPVRVLASLLPSVWLMVWVVLPFLTRMFTGWLHPRASRSDPRSYPPCTED